jgi:hypothetical protein
VKHPPESWTDLDHEMIACAKNRGIVELDDGTTAMLVSWRPAPTRPTARVTYLSGLSARIPGTRIVGTVEDWSRSIIERQAHDPVRN